MLELLAGIEAAQRVTKRSLALEPERRRASGRRPRLAAARGVMTAIATAVRRRKPTGSATRRPGARPCPGAQLD